MKSIRFFSKGPSKRNSSRFARLYISIHISRLQQFLIDYKTDFFRKPTLLQSISSKPRACWKWIGAASWQQVVEGEAPYGVGCLTFYYLVIENKFLHEKNLLPRLQLCNRKISSTTPLNFHFRTQLRLHPLMGRHATQYDFIFHHGKGATFPYCIGTVPNSQEGILHLSVHNFSLQQPLWTELEPCWNVIGLSTILIKHYPSFSLFTQMKLIQQSQLFMYVIIIDCVLPSQEFQTSRRINSSR